MLLRPGAGREGRARAGALAVWEDPFLECRAVDPPKPLETEPTQDTQRPGGAADASHQGGHT